MTARRSIAALAAPAALAAAALAACAPAERVPPADLSGADVSGACRLATVAGVAVTEADAVSLAAELSPPPSRAEAGRLAVDAALAQWLVRGYVAPAAPGRRLASYRELLSRTAARTAGAGAAARKAAAVLARGAAAARAVSGPCLEALPPPAGLPAVSDAELAALREPPRTFERRLAERAQGRPILRPVVWRAWPRFERIELGPVLADELEPELARALASAAPGAMVPPVATRTGIYFVPPAAAATSSLPRT